MNIWSDFRCGLHLLNAVFTRGSRKIREEVLNPCQLGRAKNLTDLNELFYLVQLIDIIFHVTYSGIILGILKELNVFIYFMVLT